MAASGASLKRDPEAGVEEAIGQLLRDRLSPYGLADLAIRPGEDHGGDRVLFIDAWYELSGEPVDPAVTLRTRIELRRRLLEVGEDRFPHLRHHFAESQKVVGFGR